MKRTILTGKISRRGDGNLSLSEFQGKIDAWILRTQHKVGRLYNDYFTFSASLMFALVVGACFAFIGDDCQGKINFNSPMIYCLLLIAVFFFFQTFILVPLTIVRIARLLCVAVCGHYLAYQSYGFWSLENVEGSNVCKPYTYANITYGYIWLFIPALLLVFISFFLGNRKENFNPEQNRDNEETKGEL